MNEVWDESSLRSCIANEVEEGPNLDYKAAAALGKSDGKKREITKDVSAFANAEGGTIIYGIAEHNARDRAHLPERLDPVDRSEFSKEWLEQVISQIRPRIGGVRIHPVELSSGPNDVAYVVEIPQGDTAHQSKDFRYYRRWNFESVQMRDYEIRDVMLRKQHPRIELEFTLKEGAHQRHNDLSYDLIEVWGVNIGDVVARNVCAHAYIFKAMVSKTSMVRSEPTFKGEDGRVFHVFHGQNINRGGVPGVVHLSPPLAAHEKAGESAFVYFDPILPGLRVRLAAIEVWQNRNWASKLEGAKLPWKVHADSAPVREGDGLFDEIVASAYRH